MAGGTRKQKHGQEEMNGMRGREICFCDEKCGKERALTRREQESSKKMTATLGTKNKGRKIE